MKVKLLTLLTCAPLLAACGSLPRGEKISAPGYITVRTEMHETLGEYIELTPSFKVELPETDRARRDYLETQVADFDRLRLFKDASYGADRTLPMNDRKALAEQAAREGRVTKVVPETLTISAKYYGGKKPRVLITATPGILDSSGTLRFSLEEQELPGAKKKDAAVKPAEETAPDLTALPPAQRAAAVRAFLLKKYGKTPQLKRAAEVVTPTGKQVALVEAELTFYPETGRVAFSGLVRNTGQRNLWAGTYIPQLTFRKGRDWYTLGTRKFSDSLKGSERDSFELKPGAEKKFRFETDAEVQVLAYDPAARMIVPRNAFSSKEDDELVKMEFFEKYLGGSPEVRLEMFPDRRLCADCGVPLH